VHSLQCFADIDIFMYRGFPKKIAAKKRRKNEDNFICTLDTVMPVT
jgi:hypothetical protein